MSIIKAFPTFISHKPLFRKQQKHRELARALEREIAELAEADKAGIFWSQENYLHGYTSYSSVNDLHRRSPTFQALENLITREVLAYARKIGIDDSAAKKLTMDTCWVNVMHEHASHTLHLHPLSVISGTFYLSLPAGAPGIRFEDPRLDRFMARPPCNPRRSRELRPLLELPCKAGDLVLFESWLRHEVPAHLGKQPRISISFNYS